MKSLATVFFATFLFLTGCISPRYVEKYTEVYMDGSDTVKVVEKTKQVSTPVSGYYLYYMMYAGHRYYGPRPRYYNPYYRSYYGYNRREYCPPKNYKEKPAADHRRSSDTRRVRNNSPGRR